MRTANTYRVRFSLTAKPDQIADERTLVANSFAEACEIAEGIKNDIRQNSGYSYTECSVVDVALAERGVITGR